MNASAGAGGAFPPRPRSAPPGQRDCATGQQMGPGALLDRVLEALARTEGGAGRRPDPDLGARARVPPGPSLALTGFERAEPRDLDLVASLERVRDDAVARVEEGVDRALGISLREVRLVRQALDQFGLVHGVAPRWGKVGPRSRPPQQGRNSAAASETASGRGAESRTCAAPALVANLLWRDPPSVCARRRTRKASHTLE